MTKLLIEARELKRVFVNSRFWKSVALFLVPVAAAVSVLYLLGSVVDQIQQTALDYQYGSAKACVQVFIHTSELQKEYNSPGQLLQNAKNQVERYDREFAIIAMLLDEGYNVVTEREYNESESGWLCDPFASDDPQELYRALKSAEPYEEFSLICDGVYIPFYLQWLRVNGERYALLTGVQSAMVFDGVNTEKLHILIFCFGVVLAASLWITAYVITKHWRGENARTREGDRDEQ